jgi:hypothetical protein
MRLTQSTIQQLLQRMLDEGVEEIELREGEGGRLQAYVPVTKLQQFPLVKRPRTRTNAP